MGACDVRRHQVRRALEALEVEIDCVREGVDQRRLAKPWRALEQHVPAREEREDQPLDRFRLSDETLLQGLPEGTYGFPEVLNLGVESVEVGHWGGARVCWVVPWRVGPPR